MNLRLWATAVGSSVVAAMGNSSCTSFRAGTSSCATTGRGGSLASMRDTRTINHRGCVGQWHAYSSWRCRRRPASTSRSSTKNCPASAALGVNPEAANSHPPRSLTRSCRSRSEPVSPAAQSSQGRLMVRPAGGVPCDARSRGAPQNSLRALRALPSDHCDEHVDEARCTRPRALAFQAALGRRPSRAQGSPGLPNRSCPCSPSRRRIGPLPAARPRPWTAWGVPLTPAYVAIARRGMGCWRRSDHRSRCQPRLG